MNIMNKIRVYHSTLALLSILAYVTGEMGIVHAWLGYGVALVILLRLLWALSGERMVGLMRFYPSFEGLRTDNILTHPSITKTFMLGIALSLLAVTVSGIAIDKAKSLGVANAEVISFAYADENAKEGGVEEKESLLTESHELFANMLLLFVGMHVTYILIFKFPLARFMLFMPKPVSKEANREK